MSGKLFEQIFNLKFQKKQLDRASKKCEKEQKAELVKIKKAIEKGNNEGAKIYAQNAIRKKSEALNYLRLGARLDAVVNQLESQAKMQTISKNMAGVVKALDQALATNNPAKIASVMDQFERQQDDLNVQGEFVESAMNNQASLITPEDEVNLLMKQVADAHGLEMSEALPSASTAVVVPQQAKAEPDQDLSQRLAGLRGK